MSKARVLSWREPACATANAFCTTFRHGLPRDNTHVLIVGYQTQGSVGRRLDERAKSVSTFGEKISVRAKVNTLGGFSAHAGQSDLLKWIAPLAPSRPRIIITHGEDAPRKTLGAIIPSDSACNLNCLRRATLSRFQTR